MAFARAPLPATRKTRGNLPAGEREKKRKAIAGKVGKLFIWGGEGGADLRNQHKQNVPPAKSEAKRRVAEPRSVAGETRRHGQPRRHLAECGHDEEHDEAHDCVRDEDGARAGLRERLARADDETRANRAADGNHGDVAGLEPAVQRRLLRRLDAADVARGLLDAVADVMVVDALFRVVGGVVVGGRLVVVGRRGPVDDSHAASACLFRPT